MISSFMLSSTPPSANASDATGTTSASECPKRRTSQSTPCRSAPVSSTTVNAPPIRNTKKITAAAPADILGLVHVCTARRLAGDPYYRARHGLGLDRSVPGQRPDERPGDEHAEQPGYALGGAALGPGADEQRRPEDLHALELQPADRFLRFPLHPAVENPRLRIGADRRHHEELRGAVPDGDPRQLDDVAEVNLAERIRRARLLHGRAQATENVMHAREIGDLGQAIEAHHALLQLLVR